MLRGPLRLDMPEHSLMLRAESPAETGPKRIIDVLNRAIELHRSGHLAEAAAHYHEKLQQNHENAEAKHLLGVIEAQRKNESAAVALFDRAVLLSPNSSVLFCNRGHALLKLRRFEEAVASYDHALTLQPDQVEVLFNRGNALLELARFEAALESYDRALSLQPDHADILNNRGSALQELRRFGDALASFERALRLKPDFPEALSNRGITLKHLHRFEEALASYDQALTLQPALVDVLTNRGNVLHSLRNFEDALASFDQALALRPDDADAHKNRGITRLTCGHYRDGWTDYEWRWQSKDFPSKRPRNTAPHWQGEALAGRSILVYAEQGFGDTIQFARYLPLLSAQGAKVTFLCPSGLVRLLRSLAAGVTCVASTTAGQTFDYQCALMSLPLRMGTELDSIPGQDPYLKPEAALVEHWRPLLNGPEVATGQRPSEGKRQPRVGLVWSGSASHKNDQNRSIALAELITHLPTGFDYISLQKDVRREDSEVLEHSAIKQFSAQLVDFSDTAALCAWMEIVVSVDTSVAHLAAALGKPTWVLLPFESDWRWLLNRRDSPWYPTMRLFRQATADGRERVLQEMAAALRALRP